VNAGLSQAVIDELSKKGIVSFTPVQAEAFDPILAGRDVIGRSRTGTGKTLAFGLPSLTRIAQLAEKKGLLESNGRMRKGRPVSMIVLCPTRELARQVQDELQMAGRPLGLFVDVFHGGVSYDGQVSTVKLSNHPSFYISQSMSNIRSQFVITVEVLKEWSGCCCRNTWSCD
jgi:ATP-dependent RNA helicase DDX21